MSLMVCVLLAVYLFFLAYRPNMVQVVGAALVVAGGLGDAFDRFALGYVVDFIEPVFIDFPVFNVADIGVTCGFVLFLVGVIVSWRHEMAYPQSLPRPTRRRRRNQRAMGMLSSSQRQGRRRG